MNRLLLLNCTTLWSRATFSPDEVVIRAEPAAESEGLISEIVEARVDAELAVEAADEAIEIAEAAAERTESLEQWQQNQASRLSELESRLSLLPSAEDHQRTMEAIAELQSSISALIPPSLSEPSLEPSLEATAETLTEAAAEAIAENPELGAVMIATEGTADTSETLTEASSETSTEAPAESAAESVAVLAVAAEPERPRMRARLV